MPAPAMHLVLPLLAVLRAPAPEEGSRFELRWDAAPTCPDAAALRGAVERHLGRPIAAPLGDGLTIEVHAEAEADGHWRVQLGMHGTGGTATRELAGATDCTAALDAAALVIAIAIDPELANPQRPTPAALPEPPDTRDDERSPIEPADGSRDAPNDARDGNARDGDARDGTQVEPGLRAGDATSSRGAPAEARTRGAVGATAAASLGELPLVGGHGRALVALLRPRFRVEIGGSFGGAPVLRPDGARVAIVRWTMDARGCGVIAPRRWLELAPCGGVEAGQTRVRVRGIANANQPVHTWVAFLVAPTIVFVPRPWLGIRLGLELRVPLRRHAYTVDGERVHQTGPVAGALVAGLEFRFPRPR